MNRPSMQGDTPSIPPLSLAQLQGAVGEHYVIEREVGAGGMATVYGARDLRHDRRVAIKVMRQDLASSVGPDRFLREISIAARLQHPHILGLLDSGSAHGLLYYVMPYVEGAALRVRLSREGELPLDDVLRLLRQVLDALAFAHSHGIVHRDIKPENIMLSGWTPRAGSRWHILVADFGVAKALSDATAAAALTGTGMTMGTPAYMSPEQASAEPNVDHRADVYALGAMAYEMLAGVPPFAGANAQQVIAAHMTRKPEPISRYRDNVPAELEQLVMRALEKRPADRWQSADEMLVRLEAVMTPSHGTAVTPPGTRLNVVERTFKLGESVCRKLDRATLDPRAIGAVVSYLDNGSSSDTLVFLIPGLGEDADVFRDAMTTWHHRTVAPTPFGFESAARRRVPLSIGNHVGILRELLRATIAEVAPVTVVLAGFSSGADLALRLVSDSGDELPRIDGVVALGCNLSIDTCFVTRVFARVHPDNETELLSDMHHISAACGTLDEWVDVHDYLVRFLRKFGRDVPAIRRFAQDISSPFEVAGEMTFAGWFRAANARVPVVRCVFDESTTSIGVLQQLRMRNLDEPILGEEFAEDAIIIEPGAGHFDLRRPEIMRRHLDGVVEAIRRRVP